MRLVRLGTRSSPLALAQTQLVVDALTRAEGEADLRIELVPMTTSADRDPRPLSELGERGAFASELERALLAGEIDAAVHSCKDLPLEDTGGLAIAATLPREDPRDVLCGVAASLDELPADARIATSSSRRAAALRTLRADLEPVSIRGNIQTRLEKSRERGDDACMLAAAGLHRMGLAEHIGFALEPDVCVPEPGQGAIVVQVRSGETESPIDWRALDDAATARDVRLERLIGRTLGGGCDMPVGAHVRTADSGREALVFVAPEEGAGTIVRVELADQTDQLAELQCVVHAVLEAAPLVSARAVEVPS